MLFIRYMPIGVLLFAVAASLACASEPTPAPTATPLSTDSCGADFATCRDPNISGCCNLDASSRFHVNAYTLRLQQCNVQGVSGLWSHQQSDI